MNILQCLRECHRDAELREPGCIAVLDTLKRTLEISSVSALDVITECLRLLRNGCANHLVQDAIIEYDGFVGNILPSLIEKFLLAQCRQVCSEEFASKIVSCSRCVLQFLGNLVVNNQRNMLIVWNNIHQHFEWLIGQTDDALIRQYSCMLLYNCIKHMPSHRRQLIDANRCRLIATVLSLTLKDEIEWGLYAIELMLAEEGFLPELLVLLNADERYFLLDVIITHLQNLNVPHPNFSAYLNVTNLEFLKEQFVAKVETLLNMVRNLDMQSEEPVLITKLLKILCCSSCIPQYNEYLQSDGSLVIVATYFLKNVHLAGKAGAEHFAPVERVFLNDPEIRNPVHGVKGDLVRLVGNLCWKHKANQDKVREVDGIAVLLDCCKIDANNPFITQWAVFAIRNLCDKNPENQALIASMESVGPAKPGSGSRGDFPNGNSPAAAAEAGNVRDDVSRCEQLLEEMSVSETRESRRNDDSDIQDLFS